MSALNVNLQKLMKSASANVVEALVIVSLCSLGLCKGKKKLTDSQLLQMVVVLTLALVVVDSFAPVMSASLRQGLGFAVGAMVVGFSP